MRSSVVKPASPAASRERAGPAEPGRLVEGQPSEELALALPQRADAIVEAGQRDPALLVVQPAQQIRQHVQRIVDAAAERAAVQIAVGPVQIQLAVDDPAHARAEAGRLTVEDAGVGHHHDIALQLVAMGPEQFGEVRRAGLLLTLDQQLDRDRRGDAALRRKVGGEPVQVHQHLALVVGGAAAQ